MSGCGEQVLDKARSRISACRGISGWQCGPGHQTSEDGFFDALGDSVIILCGVDTHYNQSRFEVLGSLPHCLWISDERVVCLSQPCAVLLGSWCPAVIVICCFLLFSYRHCAWRGE